MQRQKMTSIRVILSLRVGFLSVRICFGLSVFSGAVVISNIWCDICRIRFFWASIFRRAILHDPVMYPEPDVFKPERFINPDGSLRDDSVLTSPFGFGKRVCPGRHLADATLFIAIASLLSVFNIKKSNLTDDGPDMYPTTGKGFWCDHRVLPVMREALRADMHFLVSAPCPFTCSIIPRDRRAEQLIAANDSEE